MGCPEGNYTEPRSGLKLLTDEMVHLVGSLKYCIGFRVRVPQISTAGRAYQDSYGSREGLHGRFIDLHTYYIYI